MAARRLSPDAVKAAVGRIARRFGGNVRQEWQESCHMGSVYRAKLFGKTVHPDDAEKASAQKSDLLRMAIIMSTQCIPLPFIPSILLFLLMKTGKMLNIRVVPSSWTDD